MLKKRGKEKLSMLDAKKQQIIKDEDERVKSDLNSGKICS